MCQYNRDMGEGCKPFAVRRTARNAASGHGARRTAHDAQRTAHGARRTAHDARPQSKSKEHAAKSRNDATRHDRPHHPTMGDSGTAGSGGGEAHIGGVANTQTGSFRVSGRVGMGARVVNVSGRGRWRVGVVVGVIPYGAYPAAWCRRHGFKVLFREGTGPTVRERYVVESGGVYYVPERVREYGDGDNI